MRIRNIRSSDYPSIIAVVDDWWGGRHMSDMLPKLFFIHFQETSFAIENDDQIVGFLIGFLSQTFHDEAYIHFVGIHPDYRQHGLGRQLYQRFFATVKTHQRFIVRCVTSPMNRSSIAFHSKMGFEAEPSDQYENGVPFVLDYDGKGENRVLLTKKLE